MPDEIERALALQREQIAKLVEEFEDMKFYSNDHELSRELGCHGPYPDFAGTLKELARQIRAGEEREQ